MSEDTVNWVFVRQFIENEDHDIKLREYEIENQSHQSLLMSIMLNKFNLMSGKYYNHSSYAVAKILVWRQVRIEYFNEYIANSVGFRVLWDQWINSMYDELDNCNKHGISPEEKRRVLSQRFYMEIPLPIEITDYKQFTLTLLGQV